MVNHTQMMPAGSQLYHRQNSFGDQNSVGNVNQSQYQQMVETQYNQSEASYAISATNTAQGSRKNHQHSAAQKPPVIKSKGKRNTTAIEESYEKWSRFENFLKFAERKELKDRLKELDPPPLSNYIDPSTIDSINKARKDPATLVKKVKPGQEVTTD